MLRRFLKWNAERRAWNRDHEVAWATAREPTESGLSRFQILFEPVVLAELKVAGIAMVDREVVGERERYIKVRLAGTPWTLWIYLDGAEITSAGGALVRMEDWDSKTPHEFIATFVGKLRAGIGTQSEKSV
jgi:hypothetical protein